MCSGGSAHPIRAKCRSIQSCKNKAAIKRLTNQKPSVLLPLPQHLNPPHLPLIPARLLTFIITGLHDLHPFETWSRLEAKDRSLVVAIGRNKMPFKNIWWIAPIDSDLLWSSPSPPKTSRPAGGCEGDAGFPWNDKGKDEAEANIIF